jgi:hypothetical protein
VRIVHWTPYAIVPAASPMSPPRIDAGIPSSKTANQAVAGCAMRPTTRPAMLPTTAAQTAPIADHLRNSGAGRGLVIALIVRRLHGTG